MGPLSSIIRLTTTVPRCGRRWVHPRRIILKTFRGQTVDYDRWNPNKTSFGHQRLVAVGIQQAAELVAEGVPAGLQLDEPALAVRI